MDNHVCRACTGKARGSAKNILKIRGVKLGFYFLQTNTNGREDTQKNQLKIIKVLSGPKGNDKQFS